MRYLCKKPWETTRTFEIFVSSFPANFPGGRFSQHQPKAAARTSTQKSIHRQKGVSYFQVAAKFFWRPISIKSAPQHMTSIPAKIRESFWLNPVFYSYPEDSFFSTSVSQGNPKSLCLTDTQEVVVLVGRSVSCTSKLEESHNINKAQDFLVPRKVPNSISKKSCRFNSNEVKENKSPSLIIRMNFLALYTHIYYLNFSMKDIILIY